MRDFVYSVGLAAIATACWGILFTFVELLGQFKRLNTILEEDGDEPEPPDNDGEKQPVDIERRAA